MLETAIKKLTEAVEENTKHLQVLHNSLRSAPVTAPAETPKDASPANAEPVAEPSTSAAAPAPEPAPETPPESEPAANVTKAQLAEATIAVAKAKGREAAASILAKYGASKVPELKPEDFGHVFADLKAVLES